MSLSIVNVYKFVIDALESEAIQATVRLASPQALQSCLGQPHSDLALSSSSAA